MELFHNLAVGFGAALSPANLAYALVGVFVGTAIGVLPGIGSLATISMLLPLTFGLPPEAGLIMLAGIYYGSQYGGSTTAILVNLPGESSSVVTAIDGYQMARRGAAGKALATAAISSFLAGSVATLLLATVAPPLSRLAITFTPADYFALMVLGLVASAVLAHGALLQALGMIVLGLLLGMVGTDLTTGDRRFTFGLLELTEGFDFVVIAMGVFGLGEIMANLDEPEDRSTLSARITGLMPGREDWRRMLPAAARGTGLGSVLGILPGGGALLSSFAAYSLEKSLSRDRARFGRGAIEGVAAPEAANNAGAQMSFVPMLTLGIPSNPVMALMIGALIVQGITPGPSIIAEQPLLFWGLVASMWIGNLMLLILNLPLIGIWVRMLRIPYRMLFPAILAFCMIGVYTVNGAIFDIYLMAGFGVLGYLLRKLGCEPAPMLMGFILGPMMEEYLRRAMLLGDGDPAVLVASPLSAGIYVASLAMMVAVAVPAIGRAREGAFQDEG